MLAQPAVDDTTAPVSRGFFLGDYQGSANNGTVFKSVFVQANSGNTANCTDVFATTITPLTRGGPAPARLAAVTSHLR